MITISWHLLLIIILALLGFGYVMTLDNKASILGSTRDWGCFVYWLVLIMVLLIYGGIVWW